MNFMAPLEKFESFNRHLSDLFEWIGLAGLLVMMLVTCLDVFGGKLFRHPVFGALDIVMLAQLVAVSFSLACALVHGMHVSVEFFVSMLPLHIQAVIDMVISFFCLTFFVLIVWRLTIYGYSLQMGREVSATIRIPLYPFAYGVALAAVPVCLILLVNIIKSIGSVVKK